MDIVHQSPKPYRIFFFWTGIIATFAYRIIIVLNFYSPLWVKISWYIGTIGFIIYFWHRFSVEKKRAQLVEDQDLISEIEKISMEKNKKEALLYIVKTSLTSKSRYNSLFIFSLSFLALLVGIILDFSQI